MPSNRETEARPSSQAECLRVFRSKQIVPTTITQSIDQLRELYSGESSVRCCMCPNIGTNETVCPGIPGSVHPAPEPCRFVKSYIDERGWQYKVMSGIGANTFKARYHKPGKAENTGWKGVAALPWRDSFDAAQADLNALAEKKGWREYRE